MTGCRCKLSNIFPQHLTPSASHLVHSLLSVPLSEISQSESTVREQKVVKMPQHEAPTPHTSKFTQKTKHRTGEITFRKLFITQTDSARSLPSNALLLLKTAQHHLISKINTERKEKTDHIPVLIEFQTKINLNIKQVAF